MSNSKKLYRYELKSGTSYTNVYLDRDVKVGDQVTLKDSIDPDQLWDVITRFETIQREDVKRGWNNNI